MKKIIDLTDEEIEDCINGSSNIKMIRNILTKHGVVDLEGWVDPEIFADWFANEIVGFIGVEEDTPEWTEAFDNNWNWGYDIADNINSYISDNFSSNSTD
jgi:hypothetical protein